MSTIIPAIAGVAQVVQRPGERELSAAHGPIELMLDAAITAAHDAGAPALLEQVGLVGVAGGWFRHRNPGQLVAERIGSPNAATVLTAVSGTAPQDLVGLACERIAKGEIEVALVLGGEARWSHQRLKRAGQEPGWVSQGGTVTPESLSAFDESMIEEATALGSAAVCYSLFEDSLRASRGTSVEAHRDHIAALWAGFSTVAAQNPYAWDRTAHPAAEIRDESPRNRMISFPYTKAMVANNTVDMGSAILLCSTEVARRMGIEQRKLVYPHVVTSSHETWRVVERDRLHGCPALTTAGLAAFEHAGIGPADVTHVDLYACFPAIVQMSSEALGLRADQQLTVTGGLGFAGAPVANSVGHAIAAITEKVRGGGLGLVHGNGGQATKHSFAVYSQEPPESFARIDVQPTVDHHERKVMAADWSGPVTVEAATVVYGREAPDHLVAAVLDGDGARGWARTTDPDVMAAAEREGFTGRIVRRTDDGQLVV